jgi:hypothetical protein
MNTHSDTRTLDSGVLVPAFSFTLDLETRHSGTREAAPAQGMCGVAELELLIKRTGQYDDNS